mmetsp:Transcript_22857/g.74610  ORF Transcript_22857/g.74610 Transcript_22857/m.74610 type:complete len:413 (-) Transcript_22857:79-1317(-)
MEDNQTAQEMNQEDAAAAWRAARTQKSCLHSGKVGQKDSDGEKWTTLEATWRVGTLPFRLAHNKLATNWKGRTRSTWNGRLEQAVASLKTYGNNTPHSVSMIRMILDSVITSSCIPEGVNRISQDLGGCLKVWWFFPETLRHQAEAERFIFYVHGPTASPSSSAHRDLVSRIALDAHAAVVLVDYRRTPENTREESQEDINKAFRWFIEQPGVCPANLLVACDGLGASLAINLLCEIRDERTRGGADLLPAGLVLISPWVDLAESSGSSWEKFSSVDWVSKRIQSFVAADYAGLLPLTDPLVSATLADFKGFPPVYISVGQCEVYHDQIVALSEKMRNAELIVELDEAQDMVHCYQFFSSLHSACAAGILRIAAFARKFAPGHLRLSTEQVDAIIAQGQAGSDVFKPPPAEG